jgi:hypothetical protein
MIFAEHAHTGRRLAAHLFGLRDQNPEAASPSSRLAWSPASRRACSIQ